MASKNPRLRIRLMDKASYLRLKAILSYESSLRSRSTGQTVFDLVMSGVDLESYPDEIRGRIAELEGQAGKQATEKALKASFDDETDDREC